MTIQVQSRKKEIGMPFMTQMFEQARSVSGVPVREVNFGFVGGGITYANIVCQSEHNAILVADVAGIARAWKLLEEFVFFDIDDHNNARPIIFDRSDLED